MRVVTTEIEGEGLMSFLGQTVTLFCMNYIYTGKLVGVNDTCVKLDGAKLVFDTGAFNTKSWADAQALPGVWYVQTSAIESFGDLK